MNILGLGGATVGEANAAWGLGGGGGTAPPVVIRLIGSTVTTTAVSRVQVAARAQGYVTTQACAPSYVQTATRTTR